MKDYPTAFTNNIIMGLALLFFANSVFAQQPCNDEMLMSVKGKWLKKSDANMKTGNQAQITNRIDKMQQLLQTAYPEPKGIEAAWYRSMGGNYSAISNGSAAYELNASFKTYYCNIHLNKLMPGTETGNWFNIWANKFKWFAEADEKFLVENKPVYLLTQKMGELNGFPLYGGNNNGTSNTGPTFSKTILISRPGQLPFIPVSRKQYLSTLLKNKEDWQNKYVASLLKNPVRSDAEEEAYKKQQMDRAVNNKGYDEKVMEKAKTNFLRGYKSEKQRQQDDINKSKEVYVRDIKTAQNYLINTSAEELDKSAYMENTSYASYFIRFAKENEGRMMVHVNNNYFNNQLPAHAPQFLVVYWSWNNEKPSLDFANHIDNFNFKALQAMLDK